MPEQKSVDEHGHRYDRDGSEFPMGLRGQLLTSSSPREGISAPPLQLLLNVCVCV